MGRRYCIVEAWEAQELWVPQFALRSEVAMAGLALLHPQWETRVLLYPGLLPGLLLDFLYLALAPFAENLEPVEGVRALCLLPSTPEQVWKERQLLLRRVRATHNRRPDICGRQMHRHYEAYSVPAPRKVVERQWAGPCGSSRLVTQAVDRVRELFPLRARLPTGAKSVSPRGKCLPGRAGSQVPSPGLAAGCIKWVCITPPRLVAPSIHCAYLSSLSPAPFL